MILRVPRVMTILVWCVVLLPFTLQAQEGASPASEGQALFASIQACQKMHDGMQKVVTDAVGLRDVIKAPSPDVNTFLTDIFVGTQLMLGFGDEMFRISEQFEESCKAELREKKRSAEILRLYELVVPPTLEAYAFLVRVRETSIALGDSATQKDMDAALTDYSASLKKLVDLCKSDLGDEASRCDAIGRSIDERIQSVAAKPF